MKLFELLTEATEDTIWHTYGIELTALYGEQAIDIVSTIFNMDPTPNGKYTKWLTTYLIKGKWHLSNADKLAASLSEFYRNIKNPNLVKKDINQYTPDALVYVVQELDDDYMSGKQQKSHKRASHFDRGTAELVYKDSQINVVRVHTYEAAVELGRGGDWCIRRTIEGNNGRSHFASYTDERDLALYIATVAEYEKYLFAINNRGVIIEVADIDNQHKDDNMYGLFSTHHKDLLSGDNPIAVGYKLYRELLSEYELLKDNIDSHSDKFYGDNLIHFSIVDNSVSKFIIVSAAGADKKIMFDLNQVEGRTVLEIDGPSAIEILTLENYDLMNNNIIEKSISAAAGVFSMGEYTTEYIGVENTPDGIGALMDVFSTWFNLSMCYDDVVYGRLTNDYAQDLLIFGGSSMDTEDTEDGITLIINGPEDEPKARVEYKFNFYKETLSIDIMDYDGDNPNNHIFSEPNIRIDSELDIEKIVDITLTGLKKISK